jgi:hypothetical protein
VRYSVYRAIFHKVRLELQWTSVAPFLV